MQLPSIRSTRSRWLIGGLLGGPTGFLIAIAAQIPRVAWLMTLWGAVVGGNLAILLRVEDGRVVFDRVAFSDQWGAGSFRRFRKSWIFNKDDPQAVVAGFAIMIVGLMVLAKAAFDASDVKRGQLAIVGISLLILAAWCIRAQLVHWIEGNAMTRVKTASGTILLILGIGIIAANLPDTIRYMLHADADVYLDSGSIGLAFGSVLMAAGWFLRRPVAGR